MTVSFTFTQHEDSYKIEKLFRDGVASRIRINPQCYTEYQSDKITSQLIDLIELELEAEHTDSGLSEKSDFIPLSEKEKDEIICAFKLIGMVAVCTN